MAWGGVEPVQRITDMTVCHGPGWRFLCWLGRMRRREVDRHRVAGQGVNSVLLGRQKRIHISRWCCQLQYHDLYALAGIIDM